MPHNKVTLTQSNFSSESKPAASTFMALGNNAQHVGDFFGLQLFSLLKLSCGAELQMDYRRLVAGWAENNSK